MGGAWGVGRGPWVVGKVPGVGLRRVCLKIETRFLLALSVLGPNLQLPAHELRWLETVSGTFQDADFDGS